MLRLQHSLIVKVKPFQRGIFCCSLLRYVVVEFALKKLIMYVLNVYVTSDRGQHLSDQDYHRIADQTLEQLSDQFTELEEVLGDKAKNLDVELTQGVLTFRLAAKGTYVINKQPPTKQIWFSSPISRGPKRFDYNIGVNEWIDARSEKSLQELLSEELSKLFSITYDIELQSIDQDV
ncbi:hypothetical protein MIR68_003841 [Amoeboaphelidium protococcarum]|nr:hypothetical protein MIR68_003841 [Amoeboaphelidium protococcarum]